MQNAAAKLFIILALSSLTGTAAGHGVASKPAAGDKARQVRDAARVIEFPDTAEYQTLTVDLHTHSVFSDGHVWPKIRVEEALRDGLDALAITEHLEYQPHRFDIPHADRNRAYQEALEAAAGSNLIVIAGSEITREDPVGHMNAVFIEDANKLFNADEDAADPRDAIAYYTEAGEWPAQNAVDAAIEQGAFVFWNHPYWSRQRPDAIARMNDFHLANIKKGKLHGIEIANGQDYSAEAHQIALDHDLTLIGVSDVHDLVDWDYDVAAGGHRPVNLVFVKERSAAAIQDALVDGRAVVWFRNLLIGREGVLQPLLDASLTAGMARYRLGTQVLDVTIHNHSDANFELENLSDYTFMDHANHLTVPAHDSLTFSVKPGALEENVALRFAVTNALLTPTKSAEITLNFNAPVMRSP